MNKNFSITHAFKFGFWAMAENLPILLLIQLVRSIVWVAGLALFWVLFYGAMPTYKILTQSFFYGYSIDALWDCFDFAYVNIFLASLVLTVIDTVLVALLFKIALRIHDEGRTGFSELAISPALLINFIVLNILYKGIVSLGFLLLVIPGLWWAVQFGFSYQALVDHNVTPLEALRISSYLTKGIRLKLFLFWLLIMLVNVIGYAFFIVGTFFAMPFTLLAQIFVYRKLQ